jgi:hypothetical protein
MKMPRACPVEFQARRYNPLGHSDEDATGLSRGVLTFAATQNPKQGLEMPRACPVEFSRLPLLPHL